MLQLVPLAYQGGFEYKRAIVDCIISIIEENPESKESGLAHLCEFIEDCEHTVLATKILHLLGKEGPRTPSPSKYIRFIFNRVVLENEAVRAGKLLCSCQVLVVLEAKKGALLPTGRRLGLIGSPPSGWGLSRCGWLLICK